MDELYLSQPPRKPVCSATSHGVNVRRLAEKEVAGLKGSWLKINLKDCGEWANLRAELKKAPQIEVDYLQLKVPGLVSTRDVRY